MSTNQQGIAYARLGTRGVQFVFCLFGLAFTAGGFRRYSGDGYSGGASTSEAIFVILMTYTGMLYSLWHLAAVEIFHMANRLLPMVEQGIDGLLAFMLLIAGSVQAASGVVRHCSSFDIKDENTQNALDSVIGSSNAHSPFRCGVLKTGVAFTFLAMFAFIASIAITFIADKNNNQPTQQQQDIEAQHHDLAVGTAYQKNATPSAAPLSPMGHGV